MELITIFVCYARDDGRWVDPDPKARHNLIPRLQRSLKRHNVVFWVDRRIEGGDVWRREIESAIDRASIAILLVDQPFLDSEFIEQVELPRIRARAQRDELVVVPILTKPCRWQDNDLIQSRQLLPTLPQQAVPLIECIEREALWANALDYILGQLIGLTERIRAKMDADKPSRTPTPPAQPLVSPSIPSPPARKPAVKPEVKPTQSLTLDLGNSVNMELLLIHPGSFTMGSADWSDARPHKVTISKPFYLGKYPVTQEQWQAVMGSNPGVFKGAKNPVGNVHWDDCQDFITKVNEKRRGLKASLPTEAQWEYACRAGTSTEYNTGDGEDALKESGWYSGNSDGKTHPVGQKKPNAWGLYDMHGNVWEWCSDWYEDHYPDGDAIDPTGPGSGRLRVLRGGYWLSEPRNCRSAYRLRLNPDFRNVYPGFRVAVSSAGVD